MIRWKRYFLEAALGIVVVGSGVMLFEATGPIDANFVVVFVRSDCTFSREAYAKTTENPNVIAIPTYLDSDGFAQEVCSAAQQKLSTRRWWISYIPERYYCATLVVEAKTWLAENGDGYFPFWSRGLDDPIDSGTQVGVELDLYAD